MHHVIEKTEEGFTCTVCQWNWKTRPRSRCPGVIRYEWQAAPDHLRTDGQLKKIRMHHGPIRGVVGDWWLYDISEATPWTSEEIAVENERRLRECTICGRKIDKARWSREYHCCKKKACLTAAIEKRERAEQLEYEREQRMFREMLADDRDREIRWARDLLTRSDWVVLDTETTGLDSYIDEVISVAVVNSNGEILLDTLIKPCRAIPEGATSVNGITNEMVANAPTFVDVFPQLCAALKDRLVIAYNEDFDYNMITGTCSLNGMQNVGEMLPDHKTRWNCAMIRYAAFVGDWHEYWQSYTWQPLPRGNHRAAGDCLAVIDLIKRMAAAKLSTEEDENLVSAGAVPGAQETGDEL